MELELTGEIFYWRGPAPYHYVRVPAEQSAAIRTVAPEVSYGWGMIPVAARIEGTDWTTALFPKDAHYLVPIKGAVRTAEGIDDGDVVTIKLTIATPA
jgi:hypothetical protein